LPVKGKEPMTADCERCGFGVEMYVEDFEAARAAGKEIICPACVKWQELEDAPSESCNSVRTALVEWFNVREELLSQEDKTALYTLWKIGGFTFGDCPNCGEMWTRGRPDDWGQFQGVCQDDGMGALCETCTIKYLDLKQHAGE